MTDTQTLEGAVALLREIRFGSPDMAREGDVATAIDAFLALPSVSPDKPVAHDAEDFWTYLTEQEKQWAIEAVQAVSPDLPADALREALGLIDSMSPGLAYCLPVVQRAYKAFTDKHVLSAEEAQ